MKIPYTMYMDLTGYYLLTGRCGVFIGDQTGVSRPGRSSGWVWFTCV